MSRQEIEVDTKEIELETWPAFVDILSSTVVVLAFAFFILVVVQSISRVTSSQSKQDQQNGGASSKVSQSVVMSDKSSKFKKLSIISPSTLATNKEPLVKSMSQTQDTVKFVPKKAVVTDKNVKVTEPGQSQREVLGEIPKFTDSRVMEVLKELVVVQQDVISQQRKVIEQQETQIQRSTKEYQSLLSLITKNPEVEDIKQKIIPRDQQAKFIEVDRQGHTVSGTSKQPNGRSTYVLSPPNVAERSISTSTGDNNSLKIQFHDNAQYLNADNLKSVKEALLKKLIEYQSKGVSISGVPSVYALSSAEGRRLAVARMLLIRSILIDLGVNKSLIKFKPISLQQESNNNNYGWVNVTVGK